MLNLLIADDDVDAWFQVNALLRKYFIKANFVTSLTAARQFVTQKKPAILFFDKHLQESSSFDFIRFARSTSPKAKIVVINHGEEQTGESPKADFTIAKPFQPEVIERAIVKLLALQPPSAG